MDKRQRKNDKKIQKKSSTIDQWLVIIYNDLNKCKDVMKPDNAGKAYLVFIIFLQKTDRGNWDEEECVSGIGFADAGGSVRGGGCGDRDGA